MASDVGCNYNGHWGRASKCFLPFVFDPLLCGFVWLERIRPFPGLLPDKVRAARALANAPAKARAVQGGSLTTAGRAALSNQPPSVTVGNFFRITCCLPLIPEHNQHSSTQTCCQVTPLAGQRLPAPFEFA